MAMRGLNTACKREEDNHQLAISYSMGFGTEFYLRGMDSECLLQPAGSDWNGQNTENCSVRSHSSPKKLIHGGTSMSLLLNKALNSGRLESTTIII